MELDYLNVPLATARFAVPSGDFPNTLFVTITRRKRGGYVTQAMVDDFVAFDHWQATFLCSEADAFAERNGWARVPGPLEFQLQKRVSCPEYDPQDELRAFVVIGWYYPANQLPPVPFMEYGNCTRCGDENVPVYWDGPPIEKPEETFRRRLRQTYQEYCAEIWSNKHCGYCRARALKGC